MEKHFQHSSGLGPANLDSESRLSEPRLFSIWMSVVRRVSIAAVICMGLVNDASLGQSQELQERPNILFVFIDDMGYGDLSCFGNSDIDTPHIDRLASEGARFEQFYVASPICSPSRVGATTGQYPARHGIHSYLASRRRNQQRGMRDFLDPNVQTIAKQLRSVGYATAHFGKWHMGGGRDVDDAPLPAEYGFDQSLVSFEGLGDRILPPGNLSRQSAELGQGDIEFVEKHEQTGIYVDRSIAFMEESVNADKRFYCQLWLNDVHDGHNPSEEHLKTLQQVYGFDRTGPPKWAANPFNVQFYAVLMEMDRQLGRLFAALDELEIADNTLVVVTSDNGPTAWPRYTNAGEDAPGLTGGLRGRKWSLYEGGIREPLIVRWPGHVPSGHVDSSTVLSTLDFLPTFSKIAGVDSGEMKLDGMDVTTVWSGEPMEREKALFFEYGRDASYLQPALPVDQSPNLAVRLGKWKLLVDADRRRLELYDLEASAKEFENVAANNPEIVEKLTSMLFEWREEVLEDAKILSSTHLPIRRIILAEQGHSIRSSDFPEVANAEIAIDARLTTSGRDGVVLAHGGAENGYALYVKEGRPHFTVRVGRQATTISGEDALPNDRSVRLRAHLTDEQQLTLAVNGRDVAAPGNASFLPKQPVDPLDVGRDQAGTVGDYQGEFSFSGNLHRLTVMVHQVNQPTSPSRIVTPTVADLRIDRPRAEYPRPIMERERWQTLNGFWNYAFTLRENTAPERWQRRLLVPFPIESLLSQVQKNMEADDALWLRREFNLPLTWQGKEIRLHIENASGLSALECNGHEVALTEFGKVPKAIDVSKWVRWDQKNELIARFVQDRSPSPSNVDNPRRFVDAIDPTVVTGFVDSVWLEAIPQSRLDRLNLKANCEEEMIATRVDISGIDEECELTIRVELDGTVIGRQSRLFSPDDGSRIAASFEVPCDAPKHWSPDSPSLYRVILDLRRKDVIIDRLVSYIAFRKFEVEVDTAGTSRFLLNDDPFFVVAAEHESWWPDGLSTAPTDQAIRNEIETAKSLGVNTIILRDKIESDRWYYWADRLGMMVWQGVTSDQRGRPWFVVDEPQPRFANPDRIGSQGLLTKSIENSLGQLTQHPSVVAWFASDASQTRVSDLIETLREQSHQGHEPVVLMFNELSTIDLQEYESIDRLMEQHAPFASAALPCLAVIQPRGVAIHGHSNERWDEDFKRQQNVLDDWNTGYQTRLAWLGSLHDQGVAGVYLGALYDSMHHFDGLITYDRAYVKPNREEMNQIFDRIGEGEKSPSD